MAKRNMYATPKGWHDIGSDGSWADYGGKWAFKGPGRKYFVVRFENMYECCGENDCKSTDTPQYLAEVLLVDLGDIPTHTMLSALQCFGFMYGNAGEEIVTEGGSSVIATADRVNSPGLTWDLVHVEACVSYGAYAPLDSMSSDTGPIKLRNAARRSAESFASDANRTEVAMNKPINEIGYSAREYMQGDLMTVRKMYGMP